MKAVYGLPLTGNDLAYWHAYHGGGHFDDLGYLHSYEHSGVEYIPGQEANDITLIVGRRSTKTSGVSSMIIAYEALCGGHRDYIGFKSQDVVLLQTAQDLTVAKANLRQFIYDLLEQSEIGKTELQGLPQETKSRKGNVTAVSLRLKSGVLITVGAPTMKLRSQAVPVFCGDEVAFWSKDKESANPDVEVVRAVTPAMQSFPFSKKVITSTPMTEEGVLWEAHNIGSYGHKLLDEERRAAHSRTLVFKGPSAAIAPPKVLPRERLLAEKAKDPDAFDREYLANFAKSVSGFLSPQLIRASVDAGVRQRPFDDKRQLIYIATLDPAFKGDAFAFTIGHLEGGTWVQDFVQSWRGTTQHPISPTVALSTVAETCKAYGIRMVTTDQHHDVTLMELGQTLGLIVDPCFTTAKLKKVMWGQVQSLLNQGKLRLLDHPPLHDELAKLTKVLTPTSEVKIQGVRDDLATVLALNVHKALEMGERALPPKPKPAPPLSTQIRDRITKRAGTTGDPPWWRQ